MKKKWRRKLIVLLITFSQVETKEELMKSTSILDEMEMHHKKETPSFNCNKHLFVMEREII